MQHKWTFENIPDQTGKTAIVTGANSGIGYETARMLALKGAHVVLACRSQERGKDALRKIEAENPTGRVELMLLDLGSLDSVRTFADAFTASHDRLDLLINNAGVMVPPASQTEEGFELQIGVNFLGHFALTGLLFDMLENTPDARIVTLSSLAHRFGTIDFESFRGEQPYRRWRAYNQSKLADLMFAIELQGRLDESGSEMLSLAAHPGFTQTDLQRHDGLSGSLVSLWSNTPEVGALPTLYAATASEATPGGYYGPDGFYEAKGYPAAAQVKRKARDTQTATHLWETAETLTGVRFLSNQAVEEGVLV